MKRYLKHGLLFVLILLLIGSALDYVVTTGLRHARLSYYAE